MLTIQFEKAFLCREYFEQLLDSMSTYSDETRKILMDHSGKYTNLRIENSWESEGDGGEREAVATILTNVTIRLFLNEWIEEWIYDGFYYRDPFETEEITVMARDIFINGREEVPISITFEQWQQDMKKIFYVFLKNTSRFSFDSFIRFRLKDHRELLLEVVGKAIDEYKLEQHYQTMLYKCRKYLEEHSPKVDIVQVHMNEQVSMKKSSGEEISIQDLYRLTSKELTFEYPLPMKERVIGPLVSMAPRKVILYPKENHKGLIQTLMAIFEERLIIKERKNFSSMNF